MRFYFNLDINLCADEKWVVETLLIDGCFETEEEALDGLRSQRQCYGWYECEVVNTIEEKFM
jgi:hypothetical protein